MRIDEFIKKANEVAYAAYSSDKKILIYKDKTQNAIDWALRLAINWDDLNIGNPASTDLKHLLDMNPYSVAQIFSLINELRVTPVKERFFEKKYRIRFAGLNSDNGKQYLSCRHMNSNFFACALRSDLKQEFTKDEIDTLMNKMQFKSIPWFKELIREGIEKVPDDE